MERPVFQLNDVIINLLYGAVIPTILLILYSTDIITLLTLKLLLIVFIALFVIFPIIFKFSYNLQRQAVFLNSVNVPINADYDHPEKYGLSATRNFYIQSEDDVLLGAWHMLPENYVNNSTKNDTMDFEKLLGDSRDVIIYNHGNSANRIASHRIDLYKVLRKFFHVIAYDYRSYGDSSNVNPTERGVVSDAMHVYKWVANRTKGQIFVWGHSLGSSISLHSLALLKEEGHAATGVFLEGAFNNMRDEISEFPLARMFSNLPWFYYTVVQPMQDNGFLFKSDIHITSVDSPIIILHAEDDKVVPIKLTYKLYNQALKTRTQSQGTVTFKEFEGKRHFGHKYICSAPELPGIIQEFIESSKSEVKQKNLGNW